MAIGLLRWLEIIRQLRIWLSKAQDLLDLPDPNDLEAVYSWFRTVLVLAAQSVEFTPTEVDDRIIAWLLEGPFATYESFGPYYQLFRAILELVRSDEPSEMVAIRAVSTAGEETAELLESSPLGIDPVTIITVVVQIIRAILELRRK